MYLPNVIHSVFCFVRTIPHLQHTYLSYLFVVAVYVAALGNALKIIEVKLKDGGHRHGRLEIKHDDNGSGPKWSAVCSKNFKQEYAGRYVRLSLAYIYPAYNLVIIVAERCLVIDVYSVLRWRPAAENFALLS